MYYSKHICSVVNGWVRKEPKGADIICGWPFIQITWFDSLTNNGPALYCKCFIFFPVSLFAHSFVQEFTERDSYGILVV